MGIGNRWILYENRCGYLRILWYSGIIGFLLFLFLVFLFYKEIKKLGNKEIKKLSKYIFLFCLIVNIKGYSELYFINYVLIVFLYMNRRRKYVC